MRRAVLVLLISVGCSLNSEGTGGPPSSLRDDTGSSVIADTSAPTVDSAVGDDTAIDGSASDSDAAIEASVDSGVDTKPDAPTTCPEPGAVVYGGHCYFPLTASAKWAQQRDQCLLKGAHLATITSSGEQTAVEKISAGDRWFGLFRYATLWVWVTVEVSAYQHWKPPGPGATGDCARMDAKGEWRESSCDEGHPAICERDF